MPLINVKVIEGVFSGSQRREIVQKLTDAMVSIEGENMRGVTWCVLEEVHSGDWAIGGNALTTQDVQALAAGNGARACPVDHGTGSRSQMLIEATSMVPW
jgi:4-oxalocrotonate tautomerase